MQGHQKNNSIHPPSCALSRASLWGPLCPKSLKALTSPSEWAICLDLKDPAYLPGDSTFHWWQPIHSLNHLVRLHPRGLFIIFSWHSYSSPVFQVILYIPWELSVKDVDMILPFQSRIMALTVAFFPHWKLAKWASWLFLFFFSLQIYPWRIRDSYNKNIHIYKNILKY